ncbi:hypothetical protein AAF712_001529 [Marasmius tenuissimus]|uniref:Uncharacterized protein n=1 Tax=Marasmius tenuissimus TaxID=585030 RepID=A0ABR3ACJ9_9AGAR
MARKAPTLPPQNTIKTVTDEEIRDWEVVLQDASTMPLKRHALADPIANPAESNDIKEALSLAERQEQMIDLGRYHHDRLTVELEKKDRHIKRLEAEIKKLRKQIDLYEQNSRPE